MSDFDDIPKGWRGRAAELWPCLLVVAFVAVCYGVWYR